MNKVIFLLIILCFITLQSFSQKKILRFEHLSVDDGLPQNTIQGIVKDKYGFIWLGTWEGLCKFDGYEFTIYKNIKNNPRTIYNNRINFLYKDSKEDIWVCGADTTISKYNYETDDFTRFRHKQLPQWLIDSLDRYKNTSFTSTSCKDYSWVVYQLNNILTRKLQLHEINNLLTQTNRETGEKIIYRNDPLNPWSLSDEYVYHMYLDNQGIFWVGTYSGGINKADLQQKPFFYYYHKYNDPNSLIDNMIRAFCEDREGNLWVGTHNSGITRINRKTDTYTHFQASKTNSGQHLVHNMIRKLYCDRFGYIWIGTKGGADRFDPKTGRFKHFHFPKVYHMPTDWVYEFMEDHNGNLWIGTWTGIGKYDRKKEQFYIYDVYKTLPKHSVRQIIEDKKFNLWVATEGGLAKIHRDSSHGFIEKLTPTFYLNNPKDSNSLTDDRIYSMLIDEEGIIWLGTAKGLNRLDPETHKFLSFNSNQGIPDEFIVGILNDMNGNLWISHKRGITRFNRKNYAVRNFNKWDGLQSNDFSENAYYRSPKTGEMFFGGVLGFNSFFPDKIKENKYIPVIRFTQLLINNVLVKVNQKINNRIVLEKPIYMTQSITLTHEDKLISIKFAALHYSSPQKNKYKYKLENFDKNWIESNASIRTAVYSNLSSGKYILKVMASNCDGIWNPTAETLEIIVLPPWWGTWWFISLGIISILYLIYIINFIRIKNYIKKQQILTTQVELRTKELKDINTVLTDKQLLIQKQADELKVTNEKLSILNSTKDRLFAIIAHDLRNPFHAVTGFSELLINNFNKYPPEKSLKYLKLINNSSTNGYILLENLLQWSRSQTGNLSFEPIYLNLWAIIEESFSIVEADAHKKNIKLQSVIDPSINVYADANMLKAIIRNLLSNAIKFTTEGGLITANANSVDSLIEVSISDTGVGIPENLLTPIFDIHTNYSTKGTANESGTGLGLIICKEFVEKHKGRIWAESEINKGSIFKFTLPHKS